MPTKKGNMYCEDYIKHPHGEHFTAVEAVFELQFYESASDSKFASKWFKLCAACARFHKDMKLFGGCRIRRIGGNTVLEYKL